MNQIDFSEITREYILKAFNKYDELQQNNELNTNRKAKDYLLFWNSKEYPHKYIVGIAYGLKYNQKPLDNTLYNSTGNHKASAQWCIEKNGFILYADKKYREYLQKKYDNKTTINTYYSDLKKAIKIFQNIERLKDKNLDDIFEIMQSGSINFEEYDKAQKELGFNDKQLFNTLKTKAKTYLESLKNNETNTIQGSETMDIAVIPNNPNKNEEIKKLEKYGKYEKWGGGLSCIQTVGQLVIFYISGDIRRYCYLAKITKIDSDGFDVKLLNKFDDSISSLFTREKLTDLGLPIKGPIRYFLNSYPKIYNYVIKILTENNLLDAEEQAYKEIIEEIDMNQIDTIQPLNQILYGPPGTGKTFNTINKALEIIFEKEDSENTEFYEFDFDSTLKITYKDALQIEDEQYKRKVLKGIFEHYVGTQIEFVTFHQSYGYEEFIEGIKAIPVGKEGNETDEMIYDVIDGIFKKISDRAKNNIIKNTNKKIIYKLNAPSINIQAEMVEIDKDNYKVLKNSKIRKDEAPSFKNYNYSKLRKEVLSNAKLKEESEYYILEEDYIFNSLSAASSVILGRMSNGLSDWKISETNEISNEKINGNYILIIDEINRGNISKIFGELITLIESTKRLGKEEQIKVRLPYSGDEFGVPSNLYIIGTMNTADRSIALMDTALRRRFHFEEMMPDLEILEQIENIDGINIKLLIESVNKRIEYLYDRDHTIGHAYFMALENKNNIETLSTIFQNKIIPLLQEYFYDDWEKIRLVLGDNQKEDENLQFIKIKQGYNLKDLFGDKGLESLDIDDESNIYEINKAAFNNPQSYIKVYEK